MNGVVDDTLMGEVSDEEEIAEIDDNHHRNDSIRHRVKVQWYISGEMFVYIF